MPLSKQFDHINIEKPIYTKWEKNSLFKPKKNKKAFCIMMPPPNVTGSLHMGHALTFTIQDVLIRYYRLKSYEVLWQPGTDHAGIATQMVVERELEKKNINKKKIGRNKFIKEIWKWKKKSGDVINNQLRRLGASADWSRERFTMDEGLSNSVKLVFVDLYNKGLIYKDKKLVNWDPKLLTAISDLEVEQKNQNGFLWHIKYKINTTDNIIVATTRPETMFGDVAVAVNPQDKRYKKLIGKHCTIPIINKKIPIIADDYADPTKGSGAVKITPAHDFNDFNIGKKHNLPLINIFNKDATLNNNVPKDFVNLDRYVAREKLIKILDSQDLIDKKESQIMVIPYGDRSDVVIEPLLTDQWFCNAKLLSKDPIMNVQKGKTKFVPKQWEKTFYNWMKNIEPWCISRQLWWGHQIPAWYGPDNKCFVATSENKVQKLSLKYYGKKVKLIQDEDVLDTWFSSALWPFSTLDWPKKNYFIKRFYPTNVLVTGFDIIFFWVARMMMMGSHFMNNTPFKHVYIHPLIRDEKGQKMSKSKGNIIDPLDLLNTFGADTLRFSLTSMTTASRDIKLSKSRVEGYRSFLTKIWNAAKFIEINKCKYNSKFNPEKLKLPINQWLVNELSKLSFQVDKYLEKYQFSEASNSIYHFIWHLYCDWYLELSKTHLQNNTAYKKEVQDTLIWSFLKILIIIHPFMPFISEYLWSNFLKSKNNFINNQKWPEFTVKKNYTKSKNEIKIIIDIITSIRNLRTDLKVSYKKNLTLNVVSKQKKLISLIKNNKEDLTRILKLNNIDFNNSQISKNECAYFVFKNFNINVPLKGIIDIQSEINRINQNKNTLYNQLLKIEKNLNNKKFIEKAPKSVVNDYKLQSYNIKTSIDKLDKIINNLKLN